MHDRFNDPEAVNLQRRWSATRRRSPSGSLFGGADGFSGGQEYSPGFARSKLVKLTG
jgi:hypothetical protein